ncbi:hypothetical protein [Streptomyces sp. NPDC058664]|uniref:hypothetical protein n=1 Tax=unclassified Streptomyces TaxID=2593676 RepID=UPI00364B8FCF
MFVAVEWQGLRRTVKVDALTASQHTLDITVYDTVRYLIRSRQIRPDSFADPIYVALYDVDGEGRARELAAALYAAFYSAPEPLTRAVPPTP